MSKIKFIILTLIGLLLVVIPFNFSGTVDTFTFFYLKKVVRIGGYGLEVFITVLVCISALLSLVDCLFKPDFIRKNDLMKTLFSTTWFDTINKIIGAIVAVMVCIKIGPEFLISIDTGGTMLSLSTQLSIIIPPMLLLQTFILECGFMEFLGTLIGFIVKPLFKISEMASVSIISAWVGPGNAAILASKQLFEEGYYTLKEAAIIGTTFSTSSIGWCVLVANVLGLMDHFLAFYLTITFCGIVVALIGVRIPPISNYKEIYSNGKTVSDKTLTKNTGNLLGTAFDLAGKRVETVTINNFTGKIKNMLTYVFCLQPIIICWGTIALVLSMYTPILNYLSYPIGFILELFKIDGAYKAAPAILSGFADNYLPVILGKSMISEQLKFIVGTMSIVQIIFMSEIGALLLSTKIINKFTDIVIIFIERTFIALPIIVIISKLLF